MTGPAAVFDFGNVLVTWDRRLLYEQLIDDPVELDAFLDQVLTLDANAELDRGLPLVDVVESLVSRHRAHEALLRAFADRWIETLGPVIAETVEVVDELASGGHRLFGLTNWGADTYELARPRLTFLDRFDGVVVSGHEGVVKPERAIFDVLCERHEIDPERSVFVDDSEANVATAAAIGFEVVHFSGADALRSSLTELGWL